MPINTGSHLQFGSPKSSWQQRFNFDLIVHNTSTSTTLKHLTLPVTCQKMVSTVSAASHTSEMEKKRKHTLRRAQANHVNEVLILLVILVILICNDL